MDCDDEDDGYWITLPPFFGCVAIKIGYVAGIFAIAVVGRPEQKKRKAISKSECQIAESYAALKMSKVFL